MTKSVYVASAEKQVSKSAIALGVIELFARQVKTVGVFRPMVHSLEADTVTEALLSQKAIRNKTLADAVGVTYDEYADDHLAAMDTIVQKYAALAERCDAIVILGSDYDYIAGGTELDTNATIAANLNSPVLFVVRAAKRSVDQVRRMAEESIEAYEARHNTVVGIIATRTNPDDVDAVRTALQGVRDVPVSVLPAEPVLGAPSVRMQMEAVGAELWLGNPRFLDRESLHTVVSGMTLPNLLDRLQPESTVVVAADRLDLLPGLLWAHESTAFGPLAAIFLTGGFAIPQSIETLLRGSKVDLTIALTHEGTFETASVLREVVGISTGSERKRAVARTLFANHVDSEALLAAIDLPRSEIRTPTMFEHQLMQLARQDRKRIVLPEASDDRVLKAAAVVLDRGVADITLLGDPALVSRRATELGINLNNAKVVQIGEGEQFEQFAAKYAELRAHKNVTIEQAREKLTDPSYYGTMMVHQGLADGMVSGAINTTANTIRPSLEFVKTKPGVGVVSGSFLMAMSNRVVVYADCAVNPDPTAEQLADIAISSAETAQAFDVEPRIAMLSYSTGDSGTGADVDKVREATALVRERAPHLKVEGPIQFDAAVDATVAAKKMPDSEVAGRATVFIFPDLNTGNNTYKAVQRTSGAVAIGPVLQGLNKPVNDLSRGALVDDIVSTITITAIQAQNSSS
ncbi:phosphate acetyltransferase [Tessaracoccus rhinocerotis]|uniref:Phosphate acetyltransferase n=1 Tax=Tessaracoccus rhinocerotis TaxID=1689449 RepID=A0A553K0A3_9ACTN|nr:phosphate acetyltransferase [Tessaracoccus rhinocerotis]TRY18125.1 phosphate acetyltransferase [Tessaracoccus rhinocerotis]